jgi:SAM-dependent methyltransferase
MDKTGRETLKIMRTVEWYNNWLFSLVEEHIKGDILEGGAGIGNFTSLLLKRGRVFAIDINKDCLKGLRKKFGSKVFIEFGDLEKGKFFSKTKKFDTIVCLNVLEHIKDDKKALENMFELLKPKGKLVLLVPAYQLFFGRLDEELGHFRRYSKPELTRKLTSLGFKICKSRYLNWLGGLGWFINARILGRKMLSKKQLVLFDKIARPFLKLEQVFEPPFGLSILVIAQKK